MTPWTVPAGTTQYNHYSDHCKGPEGAYRGRAIIWTLSIWTSLQPVRYVPIRGLILDYRVQRLPHTKS